MDHNSRLKTYGKVLAGFAVLLLNTYSFAQCSADAGENIHSCPNDPDAHEVEIGGNPTALSGTPPFEYTWSIEPIELGFPGSGLILTASDILTDTTSSNPAVIDRGAKDSITFYLKVEDDLGCVSLDTCIVSFTTFYYDLGGGYTYNIMEGDSVFLDYDENVGVNNNTPLSYLWQPSHGLTVDTLPTEFWAKPTHDISYYVTVEDTFGCVTTGAPMYHINVNHVGLDSEKVENHFRIYPNPASDQIQFDSGKIDQVRRIEIFNTHGEIIKEVKPAPTISISDLSPGTYLLKLELNNEETIVREMVTW